MCISFICLSEFLLFRKDILCMDTSNCKLPFPVAELKKCLDPRTFDLWQKIVQAEDIAAANLDGLEYCPNCDFAMIFEVGFDQAPLLSCLKSDCRLVSCRRCKKKVFSTQHILLPLQAELYYPVRTILVSPVKTFRMLNSRPSMQSRKP